jgi:tRNA A-37 threonylcarbamoyl transferase component Bud32
MPPVQGQSHPRVLKRSPARSVRLVADGDGGRVVVKRFHGSDATRWPRTLSGLLDAARAGARARNEFALLEGLHASGAPVPRPLELRRAAGGGYEVAMEWFPDAVTLLELLEGAHPAPLPPAALADELARVLAGLQARGLHHPDLHAGNVLVGPQGELVLIDFHKARLGRPPGPAALERQLAQLAAGTREFVPRSLRRRFLRSWRAALPPELAGAVAASAADERTLARRVEAAGLRLRRETVLRRRGRWTRAGTAVEPLAGAPGWQRVGADPALLAAVAAHAGGNASTIPEQRPSGARPWVRAGRDRETHALLAVWRTAARLHEHRLPCAAPLALATGSPPWLALELPAGARPAEAGERAAARDRLAALLADRGLAAALADEHLFVLPSGAPCAVGLAELERA